MMMIHDDNKDDPTIPNGFMGNGSNLVPRSHSCLSGRETSGHEITMVVPWLGGKRVMLREIMRTYMVTLEFICFLLTRDC